MTLHELVLVIVALGWGVVVGMRLEEHIASKRGAAGRSSDEL